MLSVRACAKINLALDILFKRADGYHEVEMVMQSISLADTVVLREREQGIVITANVPDLARDASNLAYRAAAQLCDSLRINKGVAIHLDKRIPLAAGLAGGSSNAAAVLTGLNKLWQLQLSQHDLMTIGAALGSDVPFCLAGGTMRAYGRGELLAPLSPMPHCYVVLAKPPAQVSTAWVYGNYRCDEGRSRPDIKTMTAYLAAADLRGVAACMSNVLESVTIPAYPEVARIKQMMSDYGAAALMSGSGPTVFGLVPERAQADELAEKLRQSVAAEIFVAETVPGME